jgi:hypothetical protein
MKEECVSTMLAGSEKKGKLDKINPTQRLWGRLWNHMPTRYKILLFFAVSTACFSIVVNGYKWFSDYCIPLVGSPHFFEDYGLFRGLGERILHQPDALFDSNVIGTWVVALEQRIFHMYSPVAAVMFVPLALLSIPVGYIAMSTISAFAGLTGCWLFLKALALKPAQYRRTCPTWLGLLLVFACSPIFLDMFSGNVSALTLLHCTLFLFLLHRHHPVLAGVVLASGFWLKLYPVLLVLLLWKRPDMRTAVISFLLALFCFLLFSLAWVPFSQHVRFFFEIVPAYSKQTTLHVLNQSIEALLSRSWMGINSYESWDNILMPCWIRGFSWGIGIIGIVMASLLLRNSSWMATCSAASVLMNVMALVSPVGWGHTFVLVLPSFLFCLVYSCQTYRWIIPLLAYCALLIPAWYVPSCCHHMPVISFVILNRYAWAGLALMLQATWIGLQSTSISIPLPSHRDAGWA